MKKTMEAISRVNNNHNISVNKLESEYQADKKKLNDYKEEVRGEHLNLLKENYQKKLAKLQETRTEDLKLIRKARYIAVSLPKTLDSVSDKEMIYITTILNGGKYSQIETLADKYKNNEDITEMIIAGTNKLEKSYQNKINEVLNSDKAQLEAVEEAIKSAEHNNLMENHNIFNNIRK